MSYGKGLRLYVLLKCEIIVLNYLRYVTKNNI